MLLLGLAAGLPDRAASEARENSGGQADGCRHFDAFLEAGVPKEALQQALLFLSKNREAFGKGGILSIADYSKHSGKKRFFTLGLETGEVERRRVSHGSGKLNGVNYGDRDHDGFLDSCTIPDDIVEQVNTARRAQGRSVVHHRWASTRPGFFKTAEMYNSWAHDPRNPKARQPWPVLSSKPRSNGMRLEGLTAGVNDLARSQGVVMHEAFYNRSDRRMGRSFGCPAFQPDQGREVLAEIKGGSLYYAWAPPCPRDMEIALAQVEGWARVCQ